MTETAGTVSLEIERKYEVAAETALPPASMFREAGFAASEPVTYRLSARYFDTAGAALARLGIAVRVRVGGKDAGWHLKQRGAEGVREVAWPASEEMPAALLEEIEGRIGDAAKELTAIAELETERTVVVLRGMNDQTESGESSGLVELADDRVCAREGATGTRRAWREWEAELLPGSDAAVLDRVEPILLAAGAQHSLSFAKIARATGQLLAAARAKGASESTLDALKRLDAADRQAARRLDL